MAARRFWRVALALVAGLLFGADNSRAATDDGPLILYPSVWQAYEDDYLPLINPSAFAVSRDGSIYGYSFCPDRVPKQQSAGGVRKPGCIFNTAKRLALKSCKENGGVDCIVFAVKRDIVADYKVLDLTASGACPSEPVANVAIVTDMPSAAAYDHSMDTTQLTRFEKTGHSRTDWSNYTVLGLFRHEVELLVNADVRPHIVQSDGLVCAGFEDSAIRVGLAFKIYIASDLPQDSCMYKEVFEHEERHHAVARKLYAEFAADATRRLIEEISRRPYVEVANPNEARAATLARAQEAIDAAYVDLYQRYHRLQGAIDTTEEYERIANACPDEENYIN